jgi:hypothetical protein
MTTISELIGLDHVPEEKKRRKEEVRERTSPLTYSENVKPSRKYECDVFNFLLRLKDRLGIQTIYKFANLRVDGAIVLEDGRRLAIEIKLRMNWKKALEAGYEFRRFLLSDEAKVNSVTGAIVFFEEFEGSGWQGQPKCRLLENGWNEWYRSHSKAEGYRLDLFRIRQGELEHFGAALSNSRVSKTAAMLLPAYEQLSDKEKEILSERLGSIAPLKTPN